MRLYSLFSLALAASLTSTFAIAAPSKSLPSHKTGKKAGSSLTAMKSLPSHTPIAKNSTAKKLTGKPSVVKLEVAPSQVVLDGPGARHGFLVTALISDGSRKDVSARATLASGAPNIAGVEGGQVVAQGDGSSAVTVSYGGKAVKVPVSVKGANQAAPISCNNDVVPVLARVGCSSGGCHGANSGKGGFKLSLRGYAPELDFISITQQYHGRRISREEPENSLFLRKPLMLVKHAGGKVLDKDSREYKTLLGWLENGAPGPDDKDPKLVSLSMLPGGRVFNRNEKQQVLVRAKYSDGRTEDVTSRALFRTNDAAVANITEKGEMTALNPGSTAVMAKYMDKLAVLEVTVPFPQKANPAAFNERYSFVDDAVFAKLKELNLEPSPRATDEEFLRRVYIDVLGTLPTGEEARAFLDSKDPDKRNKLIEAVLDRPEYAYVWAMKLSDLFLMRKEHMGRKNTLALHQWIVEQFLENRPWDRVAGDIIASSGSTYEKPQTLWYVSRQSQRPNSKGWVRHYELTGEIVSQVFLGTRINCTKCHNHPSERYTQDDYYHFAAIFAQVNGDGKADPVPERILVNDKGEVRHPRTGEIMAPEPLDYAKLNVKEGEDRRAKFVEWMTKGAGKQDFARNIVNRVWARLFATGIIEPVDDIRTTNPPKNEKLLAALANDLIRNKYDLKHLMKTIMQSRTYQTSSIPTQNNKVDTQFFSHYPVRRLPAEEMLDAVAQVTGVPDKFATYPLGTRAMELSDIELPSRSLDTFGRPSRVMPIDCERNNAPSMSQALDLFNGEELQNKLKHGEGRLETLLKTQTSDPALVQELFLETLARHPKPTELQAALTAVKAAPNRTEGMQDVFWALINSKEFMFNH